MADRKISREVKKRLEAVGWLSTSGYQTIVSEDARTAAGIVKEQRKKVSSQRAKRIVAA